MKRERYDNQSKIFREITASKFQGQHAPQFNFCKCVRLCPATKTEIPFECFPWNLAKF